MNSVPSYFERVRRAASTTWAQLADNPELAGPWQLLFKQIQIPRHVISELLQNADDAGATSAMVSIEDGIFTFAHNGRDFTESDFESLCRFGYSNKRALHTIGFRGIGFKSVFSIGDVIELDTPTLAVAFSKDKFTEPIWRRYPERSTNGTTLRTKIANDYVRSDLAKNLEEWASSSTSLLFLRSTRSLQIGDEKICWETSRAGPVPGSEWIVQSGARSEEYLLIRSREEPFPDEALAEIRQERLVGNEDLEFPPCSVEIVLGIPGTIYVILPTAVHTELSFAVNAPFIQDPSRLKLKEPEISFSNRWLLDRVGRLAAQAMLGWVERESLTPDERCRGYGLVPEYLENTETLEQRCHRMITKAFWEAVGDSRFLVTESGRVEVPEGVVAVPQEILDVWESESVERLLLDESQAFLSRHVPEADVEKLERLGCIEVRTDVDILSLLENIEPPRPKTWDRLLSLWMLASDNLLSSKEYVRRCDTRILPVLDSGVLYAAKDVVRASRAMVNRLGDDWPFLAQRLPLLDPEWLEFLERAREEIADRKSDSQTAIRMLEILGLDRATDAGRMVDSVANSVFESDSMSIDDAVRLAQIACNLSVAVPPSMKYVTRDGRARGPEQAIAVDLVGDLDLFVPPGVRDDLVLHAAYDPRSDPSSHDAWSGWVLSKKSRLHPFVPFAEVFEEIYGTEDFEKTLRSRGIEDEIPSNPYLRSEKYALHDWDFPEELVLLWHDLAQGDPAFWPRFLEHILIQPAWYWEAAFHARAAFLAKSGRGERAVEGLEIPAAWVVNLRNLPCLEDTRGVVHVPSELLVRTESTESLIDVEPFVRADLDSETTRPLLTLLGARAQPTDSSGLLNRLRTLSESASISAPEVIRLYARLDQLAANLETDALRELREVFEEEELILDEDCHWATSGGIFLGTGGVELPGSRAVHAGARDLTLWGRVGVAEVPTEEAMLDWVATAPVRERVSGSRWHSLRAVLGHMPRRAWRESQRWVNLENQLVPIRDLRYAVAEPNVVSLSDLFPAIRQRTADLSFLSEDARIQEPFADLVHLETTLQLAPGENHQSIGVPAVKPWMRALGQSLLLLRTPEVAESIKSQATRLRDTVVLTVAGSLTVVPYLDGTPAGTPHEVDAVWFGKQLLVREGSSAALAEPIVNELSRGFLQVTLRSAFGICYERSPAFVIEYLEKTFDIEPEGLADLPSIMNSVIDQDQRAHETVQPAEAALECAQADSPSMEAMSEEPITVDTSPHEPHTSFHAEAGYPDHPLRESRTPLMLRFLAARAFVQSSTSTRLATDDGRWVEKAEGGLWEEYDESGQLRQCYWPKEHCLERGPLQLPAEIWELCRQQPDLYSLLLVSTDGSPVQHQGRELLKLRQTGRLTIYPAEYRLEIKS
jgi:hypothetical protein